MSRMKVRISILGWLDEKWTDWFDGMEISRGAHDKDRSITNLTGNVSDQSALLGILTRIHDLNLPIVSVTWLDSCPCDDGPNSAMNPFGV